ncbi:MAG: hypothetical protein PHC49_19795 [Desulfuromonadaceae bacterium]|nr:hypothetical protein [Desulfuromonadaceae bacterium]
MIPALYLQFSHIYSLSAIPAGIAADKYGKKRLILLGVVLFAGLYYGFAVAGSAIAIWVFFSLYGVLMSEKSRCIETPPNRNCRRTGCHIAVGS